jgi:hypothetical protein
MTLGNAKNTPSILAYKQGLQLGGSSQVRTSAKINYDPRQSLGVLSGISQTLLKARLHGYQFLSRQSLGEFDP